MNEPTSAKINELKSSSKAALKAVLDKWVDELVEDIINSHVETPTCVEPKKKIKTWKEYANLNRS